MKSKKSTYIKCVLILIVLLVGSILGPQALFMIQDKHTQQSTWQGERDGIDMTVIDVGYTRELKKRLLNLAEGIEEEKKYYANATDYEMDMEGYTILENALNQEWATFVDDMNLVPGLFSLIYNEGFDVENWKRYVIYDEEFENGVAIMAWYFELNVGDGLQMKLLVDTEDETLYGMQLIETGGEFSGAYLYGWYDQDSTTLVEIIPLYWLYYYDAGGTEEETYQRYMADIGMETDSNTTIVWDDKEYHELVMAEYKKILEEGRYEVEMDYEEYQLQWEISSVKGPGDILMGLRMGVTEIMELVPEFEVDAAE